MDDELDHPERLQLLKEIKDLIGQDDVPTGMWVCAWLAHIPTLERFVESLRNSIVPRLIIDELRYSLLGTIWLAKIKSQTRGSASASRSGSLTSPLDNRSIPSSPVSPAKSRDSAPRDLCIERDAGRCIITHADLHFEVAHIYAYSLGQKKDDSRVKFFWDLLRNFWSPSQIQAWRDDALGREGTSDEHTGTERVYNMLCLAPTVHTYWGNARFALKPIYLAPDRKSLVVEFYWMPIPPRQPRTLLMTRPELPSDLSSAGNLKLWNHSTEVKICSGQKITLTTHDPDSHPLPSMALLEMQWILQRIAAMCGGAEDDQSDLDDDDDDGETPALEAEEEEGIERVAPWLSGIEPSRENRPAPKSPSHASANPEPLSVRNNNIIH